MSKIIENRSDVTGVVESIEPLQDGGAIVHLRVSSAMPVPGFANLVEEMTGEAIPVYVPVGDVAHFQAGDEVRSLVRQMGIDRYATLPASTG